jgi:hypothetical protein
MEITQMKLYAIVDFTDDDKAIISGNLEATEETQTQ